MGLSMGGEDGKRYLRGWRCERGYFEGDGDSFRFLGGCGNSYKVFRDM